MKTVMCVGTYPENNYEDFVVFKYDDSMSDNDALEKAKRLYGDSNEYYILTSK